MKRDEIVATTEEFVKEILKSYDSGHDWWHIVRVRRVAKYINEMEDLVDPFILDISALLHDSADSKFESVNIENGYSRIGEFMHQTGLEEIKERVIAVIRNVSFSTKNPSGSLSDPLLLVLQDADKLDAIGAIGIARAFNYGGFRNNPIYLPDEKPYGNSKSTIGHFYDKLLKLKGMMHTATGMKLADERHKILEKFLEQFYSEWEFDSGC
jgi:uncharacterized protein